MLTVVSPLHQLFESRALLLSQRPIASVFFANRILANHFGMPLAESKASRLVPRSQSAL